MNVKLLTEHHLEFLSLKGGWTGSSTLVKMPHYWKAHVTAYTFNTLCHHALSFQINDQTRSVEKCFKIK